MRKGKNYPQFPNAAYQMWAGTNACPPRRLRVKADFLYEGVPQAISIAYQVSEEAVISLPGPPIESLVWTVDLLGFLCQVEMVIEASPGTIYYVYFDFADPFDNKLSIRTAIPQSPWGWPAAGILPGLATIMVQDAPYTDVGDVRFGVVNYGAFPPPWPA